MIKKRPLFSSSVPQVSADKSSRRWVVLPMLWRGLKRICLTLGFLVLISMIMGAVTTYTVISEKAAPLPEQMVLYLNFQDDISELPEDVSFMDPFAQGQPTLRDLIAAIDRGRDDARVKGIYARISGGSFQLAHVQELRAAIKRFRESGKFAYIYAPSYGDAGNGLGGYYLASAFDEIWMQTMGVVSITGMSAEIPFFRGTMDKLGISPQFYHRKEYKTAYESLTNTEMSPANREATEQLLADIRAEFLRDIPPERGMSPLKFTQLVDKGLFTAPEAVAAGLVTKASYADILAEGIRAQVTGDADNEDDIFVSIDSYIADDVESDLEPDALGSEKISVALVHIAGAIMPSADNGNSPGVMGDGIAAADEIAPAIIEAGNDEMIEAIVVRIDSPGGSPSASESILRALENAQRKGKPVIVSMGPTAASGGYWVASYADMIFALPTTLTGSIGVVGGKVAVEEMMTKIGVNVQAVKWGENAGLWSMMTPFSEAEAERVNVMLDEVYNSFVARVSWGRGMTIEEVDKVAGGHVWTGASAVKLGLVDEIGGLSEALDYTAQLLGASGQRDLDIVMMPKPKTALEQFLELVEGGGSAITVLENQNRMMKMLEPFAQSMAVMQNPELYSVYEPLRLK